MTLQAVTHAGHPAFPFITDLYERSFPLYERRHTDQLMQVMAQGIMQLEVIAAEEVYIGFVMGWHIRQWLYVEHLAIDPVQQGQQYGTRVMQLLQQRPPGGMILEVEPPRDETALRRIRFYQQLGFSVLPFPYEQPPYRKGEAPVAMHLMSQPAIQEKALFEQIARHIKSTVYEPYY